jgi:hypothetical protein
MNSESENGSVVFLAMVLIILLLYFCLLVIDVLRAEYAANGIQRAVDAASLSGLTELVISSDSDPDRWMRSKRAALAALKVNPIFLAGDFPDVSDASTHFGSTDACETDLSSNYRWQVYDNGKVRVEIARGTYDNSTDSFTSVESATVCADASHPNAMQVTVTINGISALFGVIPPFHIVQMPAITRIGRAAWL